MSSKSFASRCPAVMLAIAILVSTAVAQAQVRYRITNAHPPGAKAVPFVPDIGVEGRISGFTADSPFDSAGFLRSRYGEFTELQTLPGATAVGVSGIGLNGLAVGGSGTQIETTMQAVTWNRKGLVALIGTLPGDTFALATNTDFRGRVIGASGTMINADTVPFLWDNGVFHVLPNPAPFGEPVAFDVFGSIAVNGWSIHLFADPQGYLVHRDGGLEPVGLLPGGTFSRLTDMNLLGTAVGAADDGFGIQNAIVYEDGQLTSLGALPGDFAATLNGVNVVGTAVGQSIGPMFPRAVIAHRGGPLEDLNTMLDPATPPSLLVFSADGINNRGEIVAGAIDFAALPPMPYYALLTPYVP